MQIAFSTSIHTLLDLHDDVFLWPRHFLAECMCSFLLMRPVDLQKQTGDPLARPHALILLQGRFLFSVNKAFSQWCRGSSFICVIVNVARWSVFMRREKACQFRPRPEMSIIQRQRRCNLHYSRPLASSQQTTLWTEPNQLLTVLWC